MASTNVPNNVIGPVPLPFNNAGSGDGDADAEKKDPRVKEYESLASALPSNPKLRLRCYQGTWVLAPWVPGIMAVQRGLFAPRRGDVVLASAPKCGTTWFKALAFATMARGAHPPAHDAEHPLLRLNPHDCVPYMEKLFAAGWGSRMDTLPSPRLMATHMHHSLLPASIAANPGCKIVYISRDPNDMVVSMWHFGRRMQPSLSFLDVFEPACDGSGLSGPIWGHVLGYWNASKASPETVLFLRYERYEHLLRDPVGGTRKLAEFVGLPFSEDEEAAGVVTDIVTLCSFEKMRNLDVNRPGSSASLASPAGVVLEGTFANDSYFRRGEAGDWTNHMAPEMAGRLDAVMEEKLRGSGLSFS